MRTIKRCSRKVLAFNHATGGAKGEAELVYAARNHRGGAWAINTGCLVAGRHDTRGRLTGEQMGRDLLSREPVSVQALYGIGEKETDDFGRQLLLVRRLVENDVGSFRSDTREAAMARGMLTAT